MKPLPRALVTVQGIAGTFDMWSEDGYGGVVVYRRGLCDMRVDQKGTSVPVSDLVGRWDTIVTATLEGRGSTARAVRLVGARFDDEGTELQFIRP